jgi:hypothetical protein
MRRAVKLKIIVPAIAAGLLAVFALVGALSAHVGGNASTSSSSAMAIAEPAQGRDSAGTDSSAKHLSGAAGQTSGSTSTSDSTIASAVPPASAASAHYLVRNGDLSLLVAHGDLMATVARVTSLTNAVGGYVMSSAVGSEPQGIPLPAEPTAQDAQSIATPTDTISSPATASNPFATLSLRVPETSFETALRRFSALGEVLSITTTSQDVTSQYVDLQARLNHFRAVEQRLVRFLGATKNVNQMLTVQDRIDKVQLTIEQLSAQLKSLRETTSYGTLSLLVREKGGRHAAADASNSFSGTLWHSIKLIARGARITGLVIAALLPFAVVLSGIGLAAWLAARRLRRRRQPAQPSLPA